MFSLLGLPNMKFVLVSLEASCGEHLKRKTLKFQKTRTLRLSRIHAKPACSCDWEEMANEQGVKIVFGGNLP